MNPLRPTALLSLLAGPLCAQLQPDWVVGEPVGTALGNGFADVVVDSAGTTFLTATTGGSANGDVLTIAYDAEGNELWQSTFDGAQSASDQARGIALAPDGSIWVCGNTPASTGFATVLLLHYDAATGALLDDLTYSSGAFTSESALDIAIGAQGDLFLAATTVGDGGDVMVLSFDAAGGLRWRRTWDGAAFGPFSQDVPQEIVLDPAGDVLVLITGIAGDSLPDYVVNKYDAATGSLTYSTSWGGSGTHSPTDLVVDASGDYFVTGIGINGTDQYSTVRFDGATGAVVWQEWDSAGFDNDAVAVALDGLGGVYVTGDRDPDGDDSNFNDDFFTVKRDAATGDLLWTHLYGDGCVGCFDKPTDVLVDPAGFVVVAGSTSSAPYNGATITFVLDLATGLEVDRGVLTGSPVPPAGSADLVFGPALEIVNAGQTRNPNTGDVTLTAFQYASRSGGCGVDASVVAVPDAGGLNVPFGLDASPAGSVPTLGNAGFALAVDDPGDACGITAGSSTYVLVAEAPGSFVVGGLGCATGGPGEVQILPVPFPLTLGPVSWAGPGQPAVHPLPIPNDTSLCGFEAFAQGLFVDLGAAPGDRYTVTNRLDLVAGR